MTQERRTKLGAHRAHARVRGIERHTGHLGYLRNAELLDQREHEKLALLLWQAEQKALYEIRSLRLFRALTRSRLGTTELLIERLSAIFASHATRLLVGDVAHDPVQPSPELGLPAKAGQPAMNDDEDFLRGVIQPAVRKPQSPEATPDEAEVFGVESFEFGGFWPIFRPIWQTILEHHC